MRGAALSLLLALLATAACAAGPVSQPVTSSPVVARFHAAERLRYAGEVAAAEVAYREALCAAPDDVDTHRGLQKLLQSLGREPELLAMYEARFRRSPDGVSAYLYAPLLHDAAAEEPICREVLDRTPDDPWALAALAAALERQHRDSEAAVTYGQAAALRSGTHEWHRRRLWLLWRLAARRDSAANSADPLFAVDHALALAMAGDGAAAAALLARLEAGHPAEVEIWRARAYLDLERGTLDSAERELLRVRDTGPPYVSRALHMLGVVELSRDRAPPAVGLLRQAARLEPADPSVRSDLGLARLLVGDLLGAERDLHEAVRLWPAHGESLDRLARLEALRRNVSGAIAWGRAIEADPAEATFHRHMADWLRRGGQADAARVELALAAQSNSRFDFMVGDSGGDGATRGGLARRISDLLALGHAHVRAGDSGAATAAFQRALGLRSDSIEARYALARLAEHEGRTADALAAYRALRGAPGVLSDASRAGLAIKIAGCAWSLGDRAEAVRWYSEAARQLPGEGGTAAAVQAIADRLAAAPPDAPARRIPGVRIWGHQDLLDCVPLALETVLRHWGLLERPAEIARVLMTPSGTTPAGLMEYLASRAELRAIPFRPNPASVRALLDGGSPVLLLDWGLVTGARPGHARVVVGYDDARGVFLIEDPAWWRAADFVPYTGLAASKALWVVPAAVWDPRDAELPGAALEAKLVEAQCYLCRGDRLRAGNRLHDARLIAPEDAEAYFMQGVMAENARDLVEAARWYEAALAQPSAGADPRCLLAEILLAQGQSARAVELAREAVALAPSAAGVRLALGRALWVAGDRAGCLAAVRSAVQLEPERVDPREALGRTLAALGRLPEALEVLEGLASAEPTSEIYSALAAVSEAAGQGSRAVGAWRGVLALSVDAEERRRAESRIALLEPQCQLPAKPR